MEKDLNAFLEYSFKTNGCDTSAYVPVIAGGKVGILHKIYHTYANYLQNASQIHYVRNDDVLLYATAFYQFSNT